MVHGRSCAIDWGFLGQLDERAYTEQIVGVDTPFRRLFDLADTPSYRELTVELLSTFRFYIPENMPVDHPNTVTFRLGNEPREMSLPTFGVLAGLYTEEESRGPRFLAALLEQDVATLEAWWPEIADGPFRYENESKGRVTQIRDPLHRYVILFLIIYLKNSG